MGMSSIIPKSASLRWNLHIHVPLCLSYPSSLGRATIVSFFNHISVYVLLMILPALCWIADSVRKHEVLINGLKRGVPPKQRHNPKYLYANHFRVFSTLSHSTDTY